jgi:flagellar P-ring protein precursor FlgI
MAPLLRILYRAALRCLALVAVLVAVASTAHAARLKDLAAMRGVRGNELIGYGLVVGLDGTGDDQQVYFTLRSVQLMLRRLGVQAADDKTFDLRQLRLRNAAAVMVTAELPPFARAGSRIDVTVSSLGNASSLGGGTLLMTPLRGVDLKVYALAQGPLSVGGAFAISAQSGSRMNRSHTTVARIPRGALVEQEVSSQFVANQQLTLALSHPDFTTATRVAEVINGALGAGAAKAADPGTIVVRVPPPFKGNEVALVAKLELLDVRPDTPAQVIVNERTGTVIVGQDVRLSQVAIAHGPLTVEVGERLRVSQPPAAPALGDATGSTVVVPESRIDVTEQRPQLTVVDGGASLADVVRGLNALGAGPRDLVAILQAIEQAGALPARLVIQ